MVSHEDAHRERAIGPSASPMLQRGPRAEPMRCGPKSDNSGCRRSSLVNDCRFGALLQQTSDACASAVLGRRIEPVDVDGVDVLIRLDGVVQVEPPLSRKSLHNDAEPRRP